MGKMGKWYDTGMRVKGVGRGGGGIGFARWADLGRF